MNLQKRMSKITYPIVCPSCKGSGSIPNLNISSLTSVVTIVCPACNGSKIVIATEEEETRSEGLEKMKNVISTTEAIEIIKEEFDKLKGNKYE